MTIGWGWHRNALGSHCPDLSHVAEKRYTKEFLDKAEYFYRDGL